MLKLYIVYIQIMNGKDIGKMQNYFREVINYLQLLEHQQCEQLNKATTMTTKTLKNNGLIYVFGCGHSHIFSEELFYRAGGLANIVPILYEPLMLHQGAMQASVNEKKNNFIQNFMLNYPITKQDLVIVISTSGINPVSIDVANYSKEQGAQVITISSHIYQNLEKSRHSTGQYLGQCGHLNIDNLVPHGDTVCQSLAFKHTPISTVLGISILQTIISQAIEQTKFPDIFMSGNITGSQEHNINLVKKYQKQIPMLTNNLELKL